MSASNTRAFTVPGSSGVVGPQSTNAVCYYGFSLRETGGAVAVVRVRDGGVVGGLILDTIAFAANESKRDWYGPQGLFASTGLYFEIVSGAVEGSVRVG